MEPARAQIDVRQRERPYRRAAERDQPWLGGQFNTAVVHDARRTQVIEIPWRPGPHLPAKRERTARFRSQRATPARAHGHATSARDRFYRSIRSQPLWREATLPAPGRPG